MTDRTPRPRARWLRLAVLGAVGGLALAACSSGATALVPARPVPTGGGTSAAAPSWDQVLADARGQQVSLWMWGGDAKGNAYVDTVLAPAAATLGVTLRRVPVADTADALTRILAEHQAGVTHGGAVDLVWVNGENFRTGQQAAVWACGWADQLPNARYLDPADPLLRSDFGTPVNGCESPWHKAQFVLAYNSAEVPDPPTTIPGLLAWANAHPDRFTYPAPPDFTGSAFLREALYASVGGPSHVPATYSASAAAAVTPPLWQELKDVAPSLWHGGGTYPRDIDQLNSLYAGDQVSFTMTYGPATLDALVANGTFPASTKVLSLRGGTLGNASFLAIPADAAHAAGAKVVANLALSPAQQLAKAEPNVWGQYTVLDMSRLPPDVATSFAALPSSSVVPPFSTLSRDAQPELAAAWVAPLDRGWRTAVLAGG